MVQRGPGKDMLIGYCGIYCTPCPGYRTGECPGCPGLRDHCKILQCAVSRNIEYCFECDEFPCELHVKGFDWDLGMFPTLRSAGLGVAKWKPYSDIYIRIWKVIKEKKKKV